MQLPDLTAVIRTPRRSPYDPLVPEGVRAHLHLVQAAVAAAAASQDKGEPTIVWYGTSCEPSPISYTFTLLRAWSDGTVEARWVAQDTTPSGGCVSLTDPCMTGWTVISSPTEGLSAAADITFDEVVDGQDLAVLLAAWGEAPRNPMPPTGCLLSDLNS